jgi:hypothetical protein
MGRDTIENLLFTYYTEAWKHDKLLVYDAINWYVSTSRASVD